MTMINGRGETKFASRALAPMLQNESTGAWHQLRCRNDTDGLPVSFVSETLTLTDILLVQNQDTSAYHEIKCRNDADSLPVLYVSDAAVG